MTCRALIAALLLFWIGVAHAQSTLLPPSCAGKTGAELDQCVRDLTVPTGATQFQPIEQHPDPSQLLNCLMVNRADENFCIAHNEILLECRQRNRHPDFDACTSRLIERQQLPVAADCSRVAAANRNECGLRNKFFAECQQDPWRYFICLGQKIYAK